jgi:UDP-2,4-diacetamido-2,4,6-trideoxy-beta-L-altropyranose hydrolase
MSKKRLLFRADSSAAIGHGHIMRDLVLAKRFSEYEIAFATRKLKGDINHKIPYKIYDLKSDKIQELIELINTLHVSLLIIDHYDIGIEDEMLIKKMTEAKILVLDDTYKPHICDILLNHNICAEPSRYATLVPKECELWCGSKFTLYREEFYKEAQITRSRRGILIALGGTDPLNLSAKIAKDIDPSIPLTVISTSSNQNLKALQHYANDRGNCKVVVDTKEMAKLLNSCEVAIVSASTISQEALMLHVNIIAVKTADNQEEMARYLRAEKYDVLEHNEVKEIAKLPMIKRVSVKYTKRMD